MCTPLLAVQLQHNEVGGAGVPHITSMKGNKALLDYAAVPYGLHMSNCYDKFAGQYMKCVCVCVCVDPSNDSMGRPA